MPVKELIRALDAAVPANVREVSDGLMYRDFITVGCLLKRLQVREESAAGAQAAIRQLDLYPGAGRAGRADADLQ